MDCTYQANTGSAETGECVMAILFQIPNQVYPNVNNTCITAHIEVTDIALAIGYYNCDGIFHPIGYGSWSPLTLGQKYRAEAVIVGNTIYFQLTTPDALGNQVPVPNGSYSFTNPFLSANASPYVFFEETNGPTSLVTATMQQVWAGVYGGGEPMAGDVTGTARNSVVTGVNGAQIVSNAPIAATNNYGQIVDARTVTFENWYLNSNNLFWTTPPFYGDVSGSPSPSPLTITASGATGPHSETGDVWRVQTALNGDTTLGTGIGWYEALTVPPNTTGNMSIWIKLNSGSTCTLNWEDWEIYVSVSVTVTSSWQQVTLTRRSSETGISQPGFYIQAGVNTDSCDLLVAQPQVEFYGGAFVATTSATVIDYLPLAIPGGINLPGAASPMQSNGNAGTTGQVLTSQGPGATPVWEAGGGGGNVGFTESESFNEVSLSGNWVQNDGTYGIDSTSTPPSLHITSVDAYRATMSYVKTGDVWNSNQQATVTLQAKCLDSDYDSIGPAVNVQGTTGSTIEYYAAYVTNTTNIAYLFKQVGTTVTVLNSASGVTLNANSVETISNVGGALTFTLDGNVILTATDTSITGGTPGVNGYAFHGGGTDYPDTRAASWVGSSLGLAGNNVQQIVPGSSNVHVAPPGGTGRTVISVDAGGGAVSSVNQQTGNVLTGAYPAPHTVVYVFGDSTNLVSSTCQFGPSGTNGPVTAMSIAQGLLTVTQNSNNVETNQYILQGFTGAYAPYNGTVVTVNSGITTTSWTAWMLGLIPIMTSDVGPTGGIASADSEYFPAWQAFNPAYFGGSSGWISNSSTGYLQYQFAKVVGQPAPTVTSYIVVPGTFGGDNPTAWQFQGSTDGSSWTTLDTESGVTTQTYFTVSSPGAYNYYRLNVTANGGGPHVQITQFMLNPPPNGTPSVTGVTDACRYVLPSVIQYSPLMQAAGVTVVNKAAPGDTAANEVANFATDILPLTPAGGATTPVTIIYRFTQDVASCNSVAAVEAAHQSLWTLTSHAGAKFIDTTITPYGGSIYCFVDGNAAQVNEWMRSQTQQVNTLGGIMDEIHGPVNDFNDPYYYIQGGEDAHHPTDAWTQAVGEIIVNSVLTGANYIAPESGVGVTVSSTLNTPESVGATKTFFDPNTQIGTKLGVCLDPSGTIGYECFATINYSGAPSGGFAFIPPALADKNGGANNGWQLILPGYSFSGAPTGQYCFASGGFYGTHAISCMSYSDVTNTVFFDTTTGYGGNANLLANNVTIQGALISAGTKFTLAGTCSVSATAGGASAGTMTLGANTCTATIAFGLTAPNGWSCHANDQTTAAGNTLLHFTSYTQTTAVLSVPATAGTADVIDFACTAF
jgi:hypothetical protein